MVRLSSTSGVPVYRQIGDQIKQMVMAGRLPAGEQLDSVRQLAARLNVTAMTVAKAYARLSAQGVVITRPGKGVFVAGGGSGLSYTARRRVLGRLLDQVVAEAYQLDISPDEAVGLLGERFSAAGPSTQGVSGAPPAGEAAPAESDQPSAAEADPATPDGDDVAML